MGGAVKVTEYEVKAGLNHVEAFSVIGVSQVITGGPDGASEQINQLWQTFFERQIGQALPQRDGEIIYAVYSDYEGDYTKPYRLTIGYKMLGDVSIPQELHHVRVESADYAMMNAAGEQPKALIETWTAIWQSDLSRRYKTDFEVYGPNFFKEGLHEILVSVGVNVA